MISYIGVMVDDNGYSVLYGQTPERDLEPRVRHDADQGVTLFYTIDWRLYKFVVKGDSEWPGSEETAQVPLEVYLPADTDFTFCIDLEGRLDNPDGPAAVSDDDRCREYWKHGVLHREDGPAVSSPEGWQEWYLDGEYHREDGPAFVWPKTEERWYLHGRLHRGPDASGEIGPAWIRADGTKEWYQDGEQHRDPGPDGEELPAVVRPSGSCEYYRHGRRHREDGPAVITDNGGEQYWLDDENYSEEEWHRQVSEWKEEQHDATT